VVRVAQRLGVSDRLNPVPSLALGTSEVTPLELTGAYVPFANGGYAAAPYVVARVRTSNGTVLYERRQKEPLRLISPENEAYMTRMLAGTISDGTGLINQKTVRARKF
jgi:penicillin-binding protein 1A